MIKGPSENPSNRTPEKRPEADLIAARESLKAQIGTPPADARTETSQKKELSPEQEARLQEAVNAYLAVEENTRRELSGTQLPERADEGNRAA